MPSQTESLRDLPFLSIILPCRDEEGFIEPCLRSIMMNQFDRDRMEILVVDGMSADGTREVVRRLRDEYPIIRLLDNPGRLTPAAVNIGLRAARGQILMRMDTHASYAPDYIPKCLAALETYAADNVGGVIKTVPRENSFLAKCLAKVMAHPFGVGNAHFRLDGAKAPKWVETVPFFCFRREVVDRIGYFNERLQRTQDIEYNHRLARSGGKILLVPDIVSTYYARSNLKAFFENRWRTGYWVILSSLNKEGMSFSLRHLIPLAFLVSLVGLAAIGVVWTPAAWGLLAVFVAYSALAAFSSWQIAAKEADWRYVLVMPWIFLALHLCYGMGSLYGLIRGGISLTARGPNA